MSAIDPSYIRNIRDGLKSEQIEANNLEALPEGLVGLYDKELFPPSLKWKERKDTLQFFLVFALAQKEISADFASTILGDEWCKVLPNESETNEEKRLKKVNEFIQLHSKRFTSGGEGKYRLYHERFRVYILQKVSEGDLTQFNQLFISLCESELKKNSEKDISEKEIYALEFLSTHYFISAMQGEKVCLNKKDAASLKNLAYDQQFWERQVKASKGFEWSKKMLNEIMQWASKFEEEEVIECALNKVDLYNQEQNDAPRIVQLVADGDIEIALGRLESFTPEIGFVLIILSMIELLENEAKRENYKILIKKIEDYFKLKFIEIERFNKILVPDLILQLIGKLKENDIKFNLLNEFINKDNIEWIEPVQQIGLLSKDSTIHFGNLGIIYNLLLSDNNEEAILKFNKFFKQYSNSLHNIIISRESDLILLKAIFEKILFKPVNSELINFLRGLRGSPKFYDISYIFFNNYETFKSIVFDIINYDERLSHNQIKSRKEISQYALENNKYILSEKLLTLYNEGELDNEHYSDDYNSILLDLVKWKLLQKGENDVFSYIKVLLGGTWGSQLDETNVYKSLYFFRNNSFDDSYLTINEIEDDDYKLKAYYFLYFEVLKFNYAKNQEKYICESIVNLEENVDKFELYRVYKEITVRCLKNNWNIEFFEFKQKLIECCENDFYSQIQLCNFYIEISQQEKAENIIDELIDVFDNLKIYERWVLLNEIIRLNRNKDLSFLQNKLNQLIKEEEIPNEILSNIVCCLVSLDNLRFAVSFLKSVQFTSEFIKLNQKHICQLIPLLSNDLYKINHLIQMHALKCLFFQENYPQEKLDRYNRTLNIQWAIDIKNQLPN